MLCVWPPRFGSDARGTPRGLHVLPSTDSGVRIRACSAAEWLSTRKDPLILSAGKDRAVTASPSDVGVTAVCSRTRVQNRQTPAISEAVFAHRA